MTSIVLMLSYCCLWFIFASCETVDINLNVDRTNWEDPLDPFSKYNNNNLDELTLERCKEELLMTKKICKTSEKPSVDPTLKLIIRNMLQRLNVDINKVNVINKPASVYLDSYGVKALREYLSGNADTLSEREQIRDLLENFIVQQTPDMDNEGYVANVLKMLTPYLPLLLIIMLTVIVSLLSYSFRSVRSFILVLFLTLFSASFGTAYYRKYQKNVASRLSRSHLSLSESCKPKGWFSNMISWIQGIGAVRKDECLQLHEDIYVDPFFEISPLDVLTDVISNFILTPLSVLGEHLNTFFQKFYQDTPFSLIVVKTIFIIIFPLLMMFWLCGYRIRTVFATIEPAVSTSEVSVTPVLSQDGHSSVLKITAPSNNSVKLVVPKVEGVESKKEGNELFLTSSSQNNSQKCARRKSRASSVGSRS